MRVTSDCFSMGAGSDLSPSTEVNTLMSPGRRRASGPVELDETFGRTDRFPGGPRVHHAPYGRFGCRAVRASG